MLPSEKQKILVVDDEPRNQRIIAEILEDLVECRMASSGEECLKVVEDFTPDLILLDIMMPGIDGYEVCKKLKADPKFALLKVILVSGKAMVEERLKGYESSADDYMTKPFVPEELLAKVKVFLRLSRIEKELSSLNRTLDEKVQERTAQLLEAEGMLVQAAKMSALGQMAGGIAHEINTPLGTLSLIADQVGELTAEPDIDRQTIADRLRVHKLTIRRISAIINGLRTFSRDASQDAFASIPVKVLLENTLVLCQEKLKHSGVQVEIELTNPDLALRCRAVQMSQVLLNLITNACDAIQSLEKKWLKISARKIADGTEIALTDSGPGIAAEFRDRLFHPFFTTREIGKGTGLGLSISKGIVDAHNGALFLDTTAENTRFVLQIPDAGKPA
jgi:C4-dicarboxylate-specific signal transduction histidine kinase